MTSLSSTAPDAARNRLIMIAVVCVIVGLAGVPYLALGRLRLYMLIYPMGVSAIAFALYTASRPLYVGFTLWVWFLTPLVRRLVDYGLGEYIQNNLVMTTPYLVGGIGVLGLWTAMTEESAGVRQAFGLVLLSIIYGALIGFATGSPAAAFADTLEWTIPIVTASLVLVDWRQYPRYRDVILRALAVGMGVLGLYGLYQFFVLPEWDRFWMINSDMISIGRPEPGLVRVFGPLNAPGPYAITLMVGLLGLFAMAGRGAIWNLVARVSAVPAVVALLLSGVRTAWGGIAVGLCYILLRTRAQSRRAIVFYLVLAAAASAPMLLYAPVATEVSDRTSTLSSLEEDTSLKARMELYASAPAEILANPLGTGFGGGAGAAGGGTSAETTDSSVDSGIITIFLTLGWGGTLLYLSGLALLCLWAWRTARGSATNDRFTVVSAGMAVAMVSTIPFSNQFAGVKGFYLWGFLALALAGARYYRDLAESSGAQAGAGHAAPPPGAEAPDAQVAAPPLR